MVQRRIATADLVPGEPLPWDLFLADHSAGPQLHKGQIITDGTQLGRLLQLGLYVGAPDQPSVLRLLNEAAQRLERFLLDLRSENNAERDVRDIARELLRALEHDADISLASIMLNQIAGSYAVRHCIETALLAMLVGRGMHKAHDELLLIGAAALTMNVGMLHHHDSFQYRRGPLNDEEMRIVRQHPQESTELLRCAGVADEEWLSCVLLHHENDDGSGYPQGCTADKILQNAKLIGLADRYCARVSARNYRRSILPDQALQHIFLDPGMPVDPLLGEQFVKVLGKYPPGTLVRLRSGELGVVTQRGAGHVHPLSDPQGAPLATTELAQRPPRDTADSRYAIVSALHEDDAGLHFSMRHVWGDEARL
ncbi:HD-GYP domain-containing protein [Janthinobacterium sp. HLX7-2]|uniref:HD-GYP domain-containing protein n=1 Tax=Janthinobacterium sp. HLX7-2 TaxID=1259331 RepID=UPI003F1EA982